ncbi:MAG TPA: hypothetical protein DDW83_04395 [Peptococcaceae bacterium]|nr:hypothetical protein [Peptococcaceae bacterium]
MIFFCCQNQGSFIYIHYKLFKEENVIMQKIKKVIKRFVSEKKAEGFLDVAMKILIVVVIGAAVLLILNTAVPDLFTGLIEKISSELSGINVLP